MHKQILDFIWECDICQKNKYQALSLAGLLQPIPIPELVWEDISMEFITRLPKSQGCEVIFVVIDCFSKYGHFIPLKNPFTVKTVAENFMKEVMKLHGFPESIIND